MSGDKSTAGDSDKRLAALQKELDSSKAELAAKERSEKEARHEAEILRNELENIYHKLDHANRLKEKCQSSGKTGASVSRSSSNPSRNASFDCETLNQRIGRVRGISDAVVSDAEKLLDDTLEGLKGGGRGRTSLVTRIIYVAIVAVMVLMSPGIIIMLRDQGALHIRKDTTLCAIVDEWEASVRGGRYAVSAALRNLGSLLPSDPQSTQCSADEESAHTYYFSAKRPPLMKNGHHLVNATEPEVVGQASLKACSRGTSEQSFFRRDDCDGCLCPAGSVWIHYKDPRFFGPSACVQEKQWNDCVRKWAFGQHRPNFCWEFIWMGGRQDPEAAGTTKVVMDSCALHHGCFLIVRRERQWVVIEEFWNGRDVDREIVKNVGIPEAEMAAANETININVNQRVWGFPASVQTLLKVGRTSSPRDWETESVRRDTRPFAGGRKYRVWQLQSRYVVTGTDVEGTEFVMAEWNQKEYKLFVDSEAG
jgi:hypothetical protein